MDFKNYFKRKNIDVSEKLPKRKRKKIYVSSCKTLSNEIPAKDSNVNVSQGSSSIEIEDNNFESLCDKYIPKHSTDLIGNTSSIKSLKSWLSDWNNVHVYHTKKIRYTKQNPGAKCVLLSGPPGIGKTSAAHLISTELGFEVFELNASDSRSKRLVQEKVSDMLNNSTIGFGNLSIGNRKNLNSYCNGKKVLIMDEVDGMSSDDRGGIQQLITLIKTSRIPIICICNDRVKSNIRSLANHCFDLRFQRPNKISVKKYLLRICEQESINLSEQGIEQLIGASSGDIRQLINSLNFYKSTNNCDNIDVGLVRKDAVLSIDHSAATQFIFNESQDPTKFNLRYEAFFVSYDLIPLLVADHYPSAIRNHYKARTVNSNQFALDCLDDLSRAADSVAQSDIYSTQIVFKQRWGLLPANAMTNLETANISKGKIGFAGFPTWLGKNSSKRKKERLLKSLEVHLRQCLQGASSKETRLDRLTLLKLLTLKPLIENGKSGIHVALENMNECGLSRDDIVDTFAELTLPGSATISYDKVDSKVKREFTRKYKQRNHRSQLLAKEAEIKERRIKK